MNKPEENLVSTIAAETAAKIADSRNLQKLQAKLLEKQREDRLFGPARNRRKYKLRRLKWKLRGRCHFGPNCRFENKIEETFSSGEHLYFKFSSGQLVRADRAILPNRNPQIRKQVVAAIEANANRT